MKKKRNKKVKRSVYNKFSKLPKKMQNEIQELHFQQTKLVDKKLKLADKYIIPTIMNKFLKAYNKVRDEEISLEKSISNMASKHGFTIKQLRDVHTMLIEEKYQAFMKKKGL